MTRPHAPRHHIDWALWGPWLICLGSMAAPAVATYLIYFT